MPILAILHIREGGGGGGTVLAIIFTKAKEAGLQKTIGSSPRHEGGRYLGCKVPVLQANWVGSWRWPCGFAHRY